MADCGGNSRSCTRKSPYFIVYLEAKSQLNILSYVISFTDESTLTRRSIEVKRDGILVKFGDDLSYHLSFVCLSVMPTSCNSLRWVGRTELHFRMQILNTGPSDDVGNKISNMGVDETVEKLKSGLVICKCSFCGNMLLKNRKFERVLPLPSEGWSEFADNWFCCNHKHENKDGDAHKHCKGSTQSEATGAQAHNASHPCHSKEKSSGFQESHVQNMDKSACKITQQKTSKKSKSCTQKVTENDSSKIASSPKHSHDASVPNNVKNTPSSKSMHQTLEDKLIPKQGDCFVGEFYVLVNNASLILSQVNVCYFTGEVKCKRCYSQVGEVVVLHGKTTECVRLFAHCVKFRSGNQFNKQLREEEDKCNTGAQIDPWEQYLSNHLQSQSRVFTSFKFIIEHKVHNKMQPAILLWLFDASSQFMTWEGDTEESCVLNKGLKILYRPCIGGRNKGSSDNWRYDMSVHSLEMPYSACLHLLRLLVQSTKCLPSSMRYLNGFHVGYLRQ